MGLKSKSNISSILVPDEDFINQEDTKPIKIKEIVFP